MKLSTAPKFGLAADSEEKQCWIIACATTSWLKQILKLIVLVACMTAVVFQLSECILKLHYPPVSTRTELKINTTVNYPALTICRNPAYKDAVLRKYNLGPSIRLTSEWAKFPYDKISLSEFWKEATYTMVEGINQYGMAGSINHTNLEETMNFLSGRCFTIKPEIATRQIGSDAGYSVLLRHTRPTSPAWNLYVHQVTDDMIENTMQSSAVQELIILPVGEMAHVKMTVHQLERVNHPKSPCNPDRKYSSANCEERCRWREIEAKSACSVPWMPGSDLPECNNYTSLLPVIVEYLKFNTSNECSAQCPKPCHITQFNTFIVNRARDATLPSGHSQIYLFHTSKMFTWVREHWDYDLSRFVADAGGSLGFLLGVSVLSLLSMLGKALQIFTCCARTKGADAASNNTSRSSSINSFPNVIKKEKF
ncbi:acid-sensing ion channel 4-like [Cloeon dipterum]|uniref:acid-sensing ion channel 4-like n=1 Tax=Cloeon dipterum TaxID=197152 RepID=UPI00321FFC41